MPTATASLQSAQEAGLAKKLLLVAWTGVGIGILLEAVLVAITTCAGGPLTLPAILADLVQKISWSALVCVGLALGTSASRARPQWMGFLGLMAAPAAFAIARGLHKAASQALGVPEAGSSAPPVLTLAILKAVEYGLLGFGLALLARRPGSSLRSHLAYGALIGAVSAAVVLGLAITGAAKTPPFLGLLLRGANEVLFPIGCAAVLWTATSLGRKVAAGA